MALDSVKKFMEDVAADPSIQEKLDAGLEAGATETEKLEALAAGAKKLGYDFTAEELRNNAVGEGELNEDELDNVAGGGRCKAFASGDCTCFGSGGHCTCFGDHCKALFT